ncbi:MAG: DUF6289 family protein [Psychrobium sp.]
MTFKKKALLAGLFTIVASSAAYAAYTPTHYIERIYFSDAAKRNQIGDFTQFCNGSRYSNGSTSQYYAELKIPCRRGGDL